MAQTAKIGKTTVHCHQRTASPCTRLKINKGKSSRGQNLAATPRDRATNVQTHWRRWKSSVASRTKKTGYASVWPLHQNSMRGTGDHAYSRIRLDGSPCSRSRASRPAMIARSNSAAGKRVQNTWTKGLGEARETTA